MAKKCEHVEDTYFSIKVAASVRDRITAQTGIQHYVRKDGQVYIVTCEPPSPKVS